MRPQRLMMALLAMALVLPAGDLVKQTFHLVPPQGCGGGSVFDDAEDAWLCVHDDEPPPPGVDARRRPSVDDLRGRRLGQGGRPGSGVAEAETEFEPDQEPDLLTAAAEYAVKCIGDGISGSRVQTVYAVATDQSDRSRDIVPLIRQYAADADLRINRTAAVHDQGRRIRYVTEPLANGGCRPDVRVVHLSPSGDDTFSTMRTELRAQGLNRTDRKYLVWVDAAVGICGLGELYQSDRPTADNPNNKGPLYARVDAPCFGYAETHELLHTLGAVQASAPQATKSGHCTQTQDTMCYADGAGVTMSNTCATAPRGWVDCNLDDYFAPRPPSGSYLSTHWNVATSAFLEPDAPPPPAPTVTIQAPTQTFAGTTVALKAAIVVGPGRTSTVRWSSSRGDCRFTTPSSPTTSFFCPATAAGDVEVSAAVADDTGMAAIVSRSIKLAVPSTPRPTALSISLSSRSIVFGDAVRVSGRLTDSATGAGVAGMPIVVYSQAAGTTGYRTKATAVTDADGRLSMPIHMAASAKVLIVSSSTSTWRQANSPARSLAVRYRVTAAPSATTVKAGAPVAVRTDVRAPDGGIPVILRRFTSAGVTTLGRGTLSDTGVVNLRFTPARGTYTVRVIVPATRSRARGWTPKFTITAR